APLTGAAAANRLTGRRRAARRLAVRSEPEGLGGGGLPTPRSAEREVARVARGAPDFQASAIKSGRAAAPISRSFVWPHRRRTATAKPWQRRRCTLTMLS